jgi:hypothetical protein
MAYVAEKPHPNPSADELRRRIPGWGADLDPADRPSYPRERFDPSASGARWTLPEPQQYAGDRERSIEHARLTPVFGTAQPLSGLSGLIRRFAYDRFSEGRAAHWLLLVLGDRVNAVEAHLASFLTLRPDNPITQTGVLSEGRRHGYRSRFGSRRVDVRHQWLDPVIVAGPWVLAAVVLFRMLRPRSR